MTDDDQRARDRIELERLRQSGVYRVATPDDVRSFGAPVAPKQTPDRVSLGIPLADAVWRFARDQAVGRRFLDLAWRARIKSDSPDLLTFEELQEYHDLRNGLDAEIVERLAAGELEAVRLLDGGTREGVIRVAWWFGARLDSERDEVTSDGETVRGLLFRLPPQKALAKDTPPQTAQGGAILQVDSGEIGYAVAHSRHTEIRTALQTLMSEGRSFKTDTEAHHAVLTRLCVKGGTRGYSIDTFRDVCRDLLRSGSP